MTESTRIPALTMLLETALVMDSHSHIKSNDPLCSPIDKVADIAKMKNIDKYTVDLQINAIKKQFVYFVTLKTTISFQNLKLSKKMYAWLKDNKIYITQHTMQTIHTTPIGYLLGMHPTLSSHDVMKLFVDGYIPPDIEYNLIMTSTFYITQKGHKGQYPHHRSSCRFERSKSRQGNLLGLLVEGSLC
jgi:hypothetical protein